MGKEALRKKTVRGSTREYRRGITVDILTWDGKGWFDKAGREYTEGSVFGTTVYHLKKALMTGSKSYLGLCDQNKNHRSHCDRLPRSKRCSCGGTFIFEELMPLQAAKVKQSPSNPYPGKGKKKGAV